MNGDTKAAMLLLAAVAWVPAGSLACQSVQNHLTPASAGQPTALVVRAAPPDRRDYTAKTPSRTSRYTWASYRPDDLDDGYIKVEYFKSGEVMARDPQAQRSSSMSQQDAVVTQGQAQQTGAQTVTTTAPKAAPAATPVDWAAP